MSFITGIFCTRLVWTIYKLYLSILDQ